MQYEESDCRDPPPPQTQTHKHVCIHTNATSCDRRTFTQINALAPMIDYPAWCAATDGVDAAHVVQVGAWAPQAQG